MNSRSRSLYAIAHPSLVCRLFVVCNVRAPYSSGSDLRQYFYGIRYLGRPLKISWRSWELERIAKYSDFGPIYLGNGAGLGLGYELSIGTNIGDLERRNRRYFALLQRIPVASGAHCVKVHVRYLIC